MNKVFFSLIIILFGIKCFAQNDSLSKAYLNQKLPADIPVIFAPDLISKNGFFEYPCSFSTNMDEMYFGVNLFLEQGKEKYILQVKRLSDGNWTSPERINFTGFSESEPILSPDNSKLFFAVHSDPNKNKPHEIWYVNREGNGWSNPVKLNDEINTEKYEYFATLTSANKMYFTREGSGIFTADYIDNDFSNVKLIDSPISDLKFCGHPYISPDESYLIFDSRERGGFGQADLYISFKENDKWGTPINLGEKINTKQIELMPIVTPDGKYLFFCRKVNNERDIYWVEFDVEKYRHNTEK